MHVVILNWKDPSATLHSVKTVLAWGVPAGQVHVVDNHSGDNSIPRLKTGCPGIHIIACAENLGFAGGNNAALRILAEHGNAEEYVLLLNNDAVLLADAIEVLTAYLDAHPEAGAVGPVLQEDGRWYAGGRSIALHPRTRVVMSGGLQDCAPRVVTYVPGTVFLTRVGLLKDIGLLDERYFFSGEIADFCCRIRRSGLCCVIHSRACAEHRIVSHELRRVLYTYYTLRNRFLFIRKHCLAALPLLYLYWTVGGIIMYERACSGGAHDVARAIRLAVQHGLGQQFGNANAYFET